MIAVRFIKGMTPYQAGEIAGFSDEIAQAYIKAGVAEEYKAPQPAKAINKPAQDKMVKQADKRK